MTLGDYLKAPRPAWEPGRHDCCTWVAAWIVANGHADPMGFIRGTYSGERGMARAVRRGGGLVALWARGAADAALTLACEPVAGDIAVLSLATADGSNEVCGIWTGERWAVACRQGLVFGFGEPMRVWSGRWAM